MGRLLSRRSVVALALVGSLCWVGVLAPSAGAANSCKPRPGADLVGCNFSKKNLTGKDLAGADLKSANFTDAKLTRTNFDRANLTGATVTGATVTGAKFARAKLAQVVSGKVVGKPGSLPRHWLSVSGYFVGPGANLVGAALANAKLSHADLDGANLGLVIAPCIGTICAEYREPIIAVLTGANLTDANLTDANLTGADLAGADLKGATITDVELFDIANSGPPYFPYPWQGATNLADVRSGSLVGASPILPSGWELLGGYLVGPGADLAGVNMSGKNFTTASLAPVEYAWPLPLSAEYLPTDFRIVGGNVIGPGSDFAGATLTNADFENVSLVGADLNGANLAGANMTGVVTDDTTTCPDGDAGPCTF